MAGDPWGVDVAGSCSLNVLTPRRKRLTMLTLAEASDILNLGKPAKPPYYMELLYPLVGEPEEPFAIFEPDPATLIKLKAQDIPTARAEAKGIWEQLHDAKAVGYEVWQSDWIVVDCYELTPTAAAAEPQLQLLLTEI
jgi:hypothetical protein